MAMLDFGQALIQAEAPAVIALPAPSPDAMAASTSRVLYRYLLTSMPLDKAVTEIRKQVFVESGPVSGWGTPVFFTRTSEGLVWKPDDAARALFAAPAASTAEPSVPAVEQLLQRMNQQIDQFKSALNSGDVEDMHWDLEDISKLIKEPDPNLRRISRKLENVKSIVDLTGQTAFKAKMVSLIDQTFEMVNQLFA